MIQCYKTTAIQGVLVRSAVSGSKILAVSAIAVLLLLVNSLALLDTAPARAQEQYLDQYLGQYQIPDQHQTADQYAMEGLLANSIVYFPYGDGLTYSCAGGPPFIVDTMSAEGTEGNCALEQIGALPAGVVCDIPTTITFVHDMNQEELDGWSCQ
jgi:hypothetical protein